MIQDLQAAPASQVRRAPSSMVGRRPCHLPRHSRAAFCTTHERTLRIGTSFKLSPGCRPHDCLRSPAALPLGQSTRAVGGADWCPYKQGVLLLPFALLPIGQKATAGEPGLPSPSAPCYPSSQGQPLPPCGTRPCRPQLLLLRSMTHTGPEGRKWQQRPSRCAACPALAVATSSKSVHAVPERGTTL